VELTPSEQDRLLLFTAGQLASSRLARGLKLNKPEAVAIISNAVIEAARGGATHPEALAAGQQAISSSDLLPGVASLLKGISVEAVFDDGRRLVVVNITSSESGFPGEVTRLTPFEKLDNFEVVTLRVRNESSIQISVTSHDRALAYGMRLNIPSGTHVDFLPGEIVSVDLIPISGDRIMVGFAGLVDGPLDEPGMQDKAMQKIIEFGYLTGEPS
jgi:urease subunit gamma/beta